MHYQEYLLKKLEGQIPQRVRLPNGFHLVGHVALLYLNEEVITFAELIGDATLEYDSRIRSVAVKTGRTHGTIRKPEYTLVAGSSNTVTIHKEAGVLFQIDPLRVTFSRGNTGERIRMGRIPQSGEMIIDMFACIGQFALHMAKQETVRVTAIEINHEAYRYLERNIRLNGVEDRVVSILGDCRECYSEGVADRVVLGYLHNTHDYLDAAISAMKPSGGVVHLHSAMPPGMLHKYCNTINTKCKKAGFRTKVSVRRVKSYSPNVEHIVFDVKLFQP